MNNQQLVNDSLALMDQLTPANTTAVSSAAILQRLDRGKSKLAAYLITQPQTAGAVQQENLLDLVQKIEAAISLEELQNLTFRLSVEYDDLVGSTRSQKARELVRHLDRRGRLPHLVEVGRELRPDLEWQTAVSTRHRQPIVSKVDMAVVVDVARPALPGVAQYLDQRNLAANFLLFRHVQPGAFFSTNDNWEQIVLTFGDILDRVQREFAGSQLHFFLAGPGALLFTLGCVWGTVYDARVYHYENNTYHEIVEITRRLRHVTSGWQ